MLLVSILVTGYALVFQVGYFRKFSKLQTLALMGNFLAKEQDYTLYMIAYIPSLIYIDFRIIRDDEVRVQASRC